MKPAIFALSLALLGAPTLVSAQPVNPADGQGAPQQGQRRNPQMRAMHAQMKQLHQQLRASTLGALSPANRQLLANIAGQLAISPNPDYKGAAARLDRALSMSERGAILQAHQNFTTQLGALHQQMMSEMGAPPNGAMGGPDGQMAGPDGHMDGPDGHMGGPPDGEGPPRGAKSRHAMSAGQILLHVAATPAR